MVKNSLLYRVINERRETKISLSRTNVQRLSSTRKTIVPIVSDQRLNENEILLLQKYEEDVFFYHLGNIFTKKNISENDQKWIIAMNFGYRACRNGDVNYAKWVSL